MPMSFMALFKAAARVVLPHPRTRRWKGLGADSEEKRDLVSDIDIAREFHVLTTVADGLKVLDLKRGIVRAAA